MIKISGLKLNHLILTILLALSLVPAGCKSDGDSLETDTDNCDNSSIAVDNEDYNIYDCLILDVAKKVNYPDPMFLKVHIYTESTFRNTLISDDSPCGRDFVTDDWTDEETKSLGLIQITPACEEGKGGMLKNVRPNMTLDKNSVLWKTSFFNPRLNLEEGTKDIMGYMSTMKNKFPDCTQEQYTMMAAAMWYWGEGITGCGTYDKEPADYVESCLETYAWFAREASIKNPYPTVP